VILLGGLTNPREILPAFDLFVLPSRKEGLPFALLEAMDASLPTVATRVGGVPEVITDDCGLLVEKEDPTALAQALLALLENPDLARELGTAARRRIQTKFNEDSMLEQTASVYWSELDRLAPHMMPLLKEGHAYEHDDR
jgi:glycosyltransferase involved in cell wall biosynthesis